MTGVQTCALPISGRGDERAGRGVGARRAAGAGPGDEEPDHRDGGAPAVDDQERRRHLGAAGRQDHRAGGAPAPDREQERRLPQARQLATAATNADAAELMRHFE